MKTFIILFGVVIILFFLVLLGLKIRPAAYPSTGLQYPVAESMEMPEGLPAPVERFYRVTYGDNIPRIQTAVLSGRGTMAPFGIDLPMRFRFVYEVGGGYRARFDSTFYGWAWMKVNETYFDGHAFAEKKPIGIDEGPWLDDSMNVRVYCEYLNWLPAALLNDPGVSWLPIDEDTAQLVLPFGNKKQTVIVRFDPVTGKMQHFEAMKYRDADHKILWIDSIWFDQGKRWISLEVEEALFNVDVSGLLGQ